MLTICLGLMFFFTGCGTQQAAYVESEDSTSPQATKTKISKERALEIAREDALRTYDSLEHFNIVACETARVWLIIYDWGGPEYVISKESGVILGVKKIPQGPVGANKDSPTQTIREEEAIDIAMQEARTLFGDEIGRYDVFACELAKAWRVSFAYREIPGELLPNSRSPVYVIDKVTGKVIYKEG